jgi:tripartite-type tricarboxylate transporter receptor subunit TctC
VAVTGARRSPLLPDVPTVAEAGVPGYEASAWHGVLAPRGTPEPIIQTLWAAIGKVLADPALKQRLAQDGIETVGSTPQDFDRSLQAEIEKWHKVVDDAGIKLE